MRKKVSTTLDAQPSSTVGPTDKLLDDKLARDRQRALEVVHHSPNEVVSLDEMQAELLVAAEYYRAASGPDAPARRARCVSWQLRVLLGFDRLAALEANDGLLPIWDLAFAFEDSQAGRPGRMNALVGRFPDAATSDALSVVTTIDAAIVFCTDRMREGGIFSVREAAKLVAHRVAQAGLSGTPGSIRQTYLRAKAHPQVREMLSLMTTAYPMPADWPQKGQDDRKTWLDGVTLFDRFRREW
jgi:hypothetical protein